MKKRDLERKMLEMCRAGGVELRHVGGTNHDKFRINGVMVSVPRHTEVREALARKILKDVERAIKK
jgi:hypothetical protein